MGTIKSREQFDFSYKDNGLMTFKITDVDTAKRTIMGIGNTYNILDSQLDVMQNNVFKQSILLNGPKADGPKIKMALDHDLTRRHDKITELCAKQVNIKGENMDCLYFEAQMTDNDLGNETLADYLDGKIDQHSVGFK